MGKLTLTKNEIAELKDELRQYGYAEDGVELYRLIADPEYKADISLFYSVVDLAGRDELAKRTLLKFKSTLKTLDVIHEKLGKPMPVVNFIVCDTLQRHNFPGIAEEALKEDLNKKRGQLATILEIPQINGDPGRLVYSLDGKSYRLNVQRWDSLLTQEVKEFVDAINEKLNKALEDPQALQNFCTDSYLFNVTTGLLREDIRKLSQLILRQSNTTNISDKNLVSLGANITVAGMQFLKHILKERASLDSTLDRKSDPATYARQKEAILGHSIFQDKGLITFKQGIVYIMEELFALCNKPSIYIYGAGTVTMHKAHPFYGIHDVFKLGNRPFGLLASTEFNNLEESHLTMHMKNFAITLQNRQRPKSIPIKIPGMQQGESSSSAAGAGAASDSPSSSYGSNKGAIESPPEVRPIRSGSYGGSGNSSDGEHSDSSKKSSSSQDKVPTALDVAMELVSRTSPDCHDQIYQDAAQSYKKRGSNASSHSSQYTNTGTAAVVSFGARSRSNSHGDNKNIPVTTTQTQQQEQSTTQAPTSPKSVANIFNQL